MSSRKKTLKRKKSDLKLAWFQRNSGMVCVGICTIFLFQTLDTIFKNSLLFEINDYLY